MAPKFKNPRPEIAHRNDVKGRFRRANPNGLDGRQLEAWATAQAMQAAPAEWNDLAQRIKNRRYIRPYELQKRNNKSRFNPPYKRDYQCWRELGIGAQGSAYLYLDLNDNGNIRNVSEPKLLLVQDQLNATNFDALQRRVLKVLHISDPRIQQSSVVERRVHWQLTNPAIPNIIRLYHHTERRERHQGRLDPRAFMWMDFAQYGDLMGEFLRYRDQHQQQAAAGHQQTRIPESFIWHVIQCLSRASEAMRNNNPTVIHRE